MASRTITDSASEILSENRLRKSFIIQNEDGSIACFVKFEKPNGLTVSTTDHDHRIGAGAVLSVNSLLDGKDQIGSRITIIAASGTPLISFFETEEERR